MTLRVLHIAAGNLFGGVESFLVTIARERHRTEVDVLFACCFEGRLCSELRNAGATVEVLGGVRLSRPWTAFRAQRNLEVLLRNAGVDVLVCHGAWPHAVFGKVGRRLGLPVVFWGHTIPGNEWVDRLAARVPPTLVVANSELMRKALDSMFPGVPTTVLRAPVIDHHTPDLPSARDEVRRSLGTDHDEVVIVCSSRLERGKGHSLLLDAAGTLRDLDGWCVWIAGGAQRPRETAYLAELEALVTSRQLAERVRFLGERQDVARVLAAADIHCQPNTAPEAFGIAFVEAMFAGLPVVTTDIGAAGEVVTSSCGLLVCADAKSVGEALRTLICDAALRRQLGAEARRRAAALCDIGTTLSAMEQQLLKIGARPMQVP